MDIDTVRAILCDLDLTKYFAASKQTSSADEVWPAYVEDAFLKAVDIFASVGQRKYQVDDKNAKGNVAELVGRNDIISRYIFMKTARYRSRKQVSSHIQVWAHCKKPPSSRNMSMDSFDELQTVLRLFYSRPSTAFGQPKKKLRRVVSTSNVSMGDRLATIDSLGVHNATTSQPSSDERTSERKHDLEDPPEYPVKRCRRVVSELPPTSLSSLFEYSCEDAPLDFSDASTAPFWTLDCGERIVGTPTALDQSSAHQLALQQAGSIDMCLPLLLPAFDAAIHPSPSLYQLSVAAVHGVSAATLSAATMAAMAGFEEALSSPMVHATECMPMSGAVRDNSFGFVTSGFMPTFHSSAIQPVCAEMMSAFAAAAAAANPSCSPCDSANSLGDAMGATAAAAVTTEECNQALVEAFGKYYADSVMDSTPDMQFPFCAWSEACAGDGNPGDPTAMADTVRASDCAPRVQPAVICGPSMAIAGAQAAGEHTARALATGKAVHLGINASALKSKKGAQPIRPAASISSGTDRAVLPRAPPMLAAAPSPVSASGKLSEHAKDLRSSPSCTQSMHSISRASDATLTIRGYSDGPVLNRAPEDASNELLRHLDPDAAALACGNSSSSPVIDWLNSLKNILDTHDIGPHLFVDSAYSTGPPFDNNGGHVWPFVFAHNPGGTD
ncbi:hypothetical protein GGH94_003092 [Coemansia aciculifera]|uniref:TEA domain-containing protein n=1 Tax=Coemansia aciculifera TaxID=417176 RepID=A0A9W8M4U3_9FUNG|nr:hypothetical protein GGH94_003092 [Coemansia aciculifera]KAJ2873684.1 hypothetical protein GGH93_003032 [Coemansia aciculifera]